MLNLDRLTSFVLADTGKCVGCRSILSLRQRLRSCEKIESVMLSAAKHLQYLVENKPIQILRSAQSL